MPETISKTSNIEKFFAREGVDPLEAAFERDAGPHPGAGDTEIPTGDLHNEWITSSSIVDRSTRRALYLHVPFCRSRCTFCPFYTYQSKEAELAKYADALVKEIELTAPTAAVAGHPIHSVYFGGGTPTDLSAQDLHKLISTIRRRFPLSNDVEITIEGRTSGFTPEKMQACIDAGANRFSIGVQSFDTRIRRGVGRQADRDGVLTSLDTLCSFDNAAVIIDLIYGLPGQTMEDWENDIDTFINQTGAHGIDMYKLKTVPGSLVTASGKTFDAADTRQMGLMFKRGIEIMDEQGFRRLSNCHWSRGTRERNRYNTDTAFGSTCIPIGCCAGGKLGDYQFFQETDLTKYYELVEADRKPIGSGIRLRDHSETRGEIKGEVSTGAVDLNAIQRSLGAPVHEVGLLLEQWERAGLVTFTSPQRVELTTAGRFWSNKIAQSLIQLLEVG
jgi:putative heme utilization radical SAM enzyme HutW